MVRCLRQFKKAPQAKDDELTGMRLCSTDQIFGRRSYAKRSIRMIMKQERQADPLKVEPLPFWEKPTQKAALVGFAREASPQPGTAHDPLKVEP